MTRELILARRLLRQLAPLLPVVAAATKTREGADAWVDAWSRQIEGAGLTAGQIAAGLSRIGEAQTTVPFGWPVFLSLCRPPLTGLEVSQTMAAACKAAALREFAALAPDVWQAACSIGWARMQGEVITPSTWARALADARHAPSQSIRDSQPRDSQPRVGMSDEARALERLHRRAVAERGIAAALEVVARN